MKTCARTFISATAIGFLLLTLASCSGSGGSEIAALFAPEAVRANWKTIHCDLQAGSSGTLEATFWKGYEDNGFATMQLPVTDWSRWKSLKFEVENPYKEPFSVYVRISDSAGHPGNQTYTGGTFDGFVIGPGKNSVEISLENMRSPEDQAVSPAHIAYLGIFFSPLFLRDGMVLRFTQDKTFKLASLRLATDQARAQKQPYGDLLFKTTAPQLAGERKQVEEAIQQLNELIQQAHTKKIDTAYQEIYPFIANLAFHTRLVAFWQDRTQEQRKALDFLLAETRHAITDLQEELAGKRQALLAPSVPPYSKLTIRDRYFREGQTPLLLLGMLYNQKGPLLRWFANSATDYGTQLVAGATRQNVERQPIWQAYQKYPDTHRVGWSRADHIVRDSSSWEVVGPAVNVCLESPHSRAAIAEMIGKYEHAHLGDHSHLVQNMGFEYFYACYCRYTREMWRAWLGRKYGNIQAANRAWQATYANFSDVPMLHPEEAKSNRALWYDWSSFNLYRFLQQLRWTRDEIRKTQPSAPLTVGSPYYAFSPRFWTAIDEEALADSGITAVELEENYRLDTLMPEYLHVLAGSKPVADFEYHGVVDQLLPSFLHGDAAISMWWWNDHKHWTPHEPINEWPSSFPQSYTIPLSDIAEAMRVALDVRRLSPEIIALANAPRPVALLYSKTSMLQHLPEESKETGTFPYLFSLEELYDSSQSAGIYVGLTTEEKILHGDLARRKLLVLPTAQFVPPAVTRRIISWVRDGGTLLVWPDSLLADEYARPTNTMESLGLNLLRRVPPTFKRGETQVTEYNLPDLPRAPIKLERQDVFSKAAPDLEAVGERQVIQCDPRWVLGKFSDGSPALIRIAIGKGNLYWLASPLDPVSWTRLLPLLAAQAGVPAPLHVSSSGSDALTALEFRVTPYSNNYLAYFYNNSNQTLRFNLEPVFRFTRIRDLRSGTTLAGPGMVLPGHATSIVEFFR
ncbi:MAG TPA: beta-galactosidase [Terriglobia bacterium]|nr:beta-galactosidase [Terriglobia bacterium]